METPEKLIKLKGVAFIFEMDEAMKGQRDTLRRAQAAALVMAKHMKQQFKDTHNANTVKNYGLKLQQFEELIKGIKEYL